MFANNKPTSKIDCLIGGGTAIDGDITFSGGLRIDGHVRGNVRADGGGSCTLFISEKACITGEVSVPHLVINGAVVGPVRSDGVLELQQNARITGNIEYNTIEMHLGAIVDGELKHQGKSKRDEAADKASDKTAEKATELKLASSSS